MSARTMCSTRRGGLDAPIIASSARRRWRRARWRWLRSRAASAAAGRKGAGVVKALNPFCKLGGQASQLSSKSTWPRAGASAARAGTPLPHVITTSYLTHEPIEQHLAREKQLRLPRPAAALAGPQPSACA